MISTLYIKYIASAIGVKEWQVEHCIELFEEGATVPFISRYRKERTGALDEVQVAETKFHYQKFVELDKRKQAIIKSIEEQEKMTPQLLKNVSNFSCWRISICLSDQNGGQGLQLPKKRGLNRLHLR